MSESVDLNNLPKDEGLDERGARRAAEGGVRKPMPKGDYKVVASGLKAYHNNSTEQGVANHTNLNFELTIVEPEQFKGKKIYKDPVRLFARGERDLWRDKRVGLIINLGYVLKADIESEDPAVRKEALEKLKNFDWRVLLDHTFVYRAGLQQRYSNKHGQDIIENCDGDWFGLHPESRWDDQEWIQRAPTPDQTIRVVPRKTPTGAAGGTVNTGPKPSDIDVDAEEC